MLPKIIKSGEPARLFPIVAETSKEKRVASVFLALLPKIPELASTLLRSSKINVSTRSKIHCYTEVVLASDVDSNDRPDGLIIIEYGKTIWSALVEFKIGNAELNTDQVERYLKLAKNNGIDAVITVSNQFVARADHPPVSVSKTLLRKTDLYHWPWMWEFTHCQLLQMEEAVDDPEQLFLLREFARFLEHSSTGIRGFTQMNKGWKELVSMAGAGGTFSKSSPIVETIVAGWIEEQRDLSLLMSRSIGQVVRQKIPRSHINDPSERLKAEIDEFCNTRDLTATFQVPDAASDIFVEADLVRKSIDVSMKLKAPEDRKSTKARVNWLLRMLKEDDDRIVIRAHWPSKVKYTQRTLSALREQPDLIQTDNTSLVPHSFEILLINNLSKRFGGTQTFIQDLEHVVPEFYELIGQSLKAWQPSAPKPIKPTLLVLGMAERISENGSD